MELELATDENEVQHEVSSTQRFRRSNKGISNSISETYYDVISNINVIYILINVLSRSQKFLKFLVLIVIH